VTRRAALWLAALAAWVGVTAGPASAQHTAEPDHTAAFRADSLRLAGRPWHAAETLLAAARGNPAPNAFLIVEGAKAELLARRYARAQELLAGRPWLDAYAGGEALAVLARAEHGLGRYADAAAHFGAARRHASGSRAALLAVRAGLAHEAAGQVDSAAAAYAAARADGRLATIEPWLKVRQARVTRDTAAAADLLAGIVAPAARDAALARARSLLLAADTARAIEAFTQAGKGLEVARLALASRDSARARAALYDLMARAPQTDDAAVAVRLALGPLPPRTAAERVALGRAMNRRGSTSDARVHVERALRTGDSSAATLMLYAELLAAGSRWREAARAYQAAARDSAYRATALYRRARVLVRMGDVAATGALSGFAAAHPSDSGAPGALYLLGDMLEDRRDSAGAARWFGELIARYPSDNRASLARFRLAARAERGRQLDSASALYRAEIAAGGPQQNAARYWLGKLALAQGDSARARELWTGLARADSLGYYGMRARAEAGMPPLVIAPSDAPPPPDTVAAGLARIDTLLLAGLDTAAQTEIRLLLSRPPRDLDALLAWSEGLSARGFGAAAVRLGWQAALQAPGAARVLRAIFPWPNRAAVEAEADEFGVDGLLLAAIVRQESVFDVEALSPAGARGLAQLMPGTAALTARGLDVAFYPEWITVPDLNLHLGAAHLAQLLRRFTRLDAAVAAYNAGGTPVRRWLDRNGALDPDRFIELIPYPETRGYVRSVLRNRELYRALYVAPPPASPPAPAVP
jgi:soluble lytic murein transglycosylase